MKPNTKIVLIATCLAVSLALPTSAQISGIAGFSQDFVSDYKAAQETMNQTKSAEPLIALLQRYTSPGEQAELEVTIGRAYGQQAGVRNPANAVIHLTNALRYQNILPDKTYIEIVMWRGNSQEQQKHFDEALWDYLRGLLACSNYDLSAGWPEMSLSTEPPSVSVATMQQDGRDQEQRSQDYKAYRKNVDFQQFLLGERFGAIAGVKRMRKGRSDDQLLEMLRLLTPDSSKFMEIVGWVNSGNKNPLHAKGPLP